MYDFVNIFSFCKA